MRFEMASEFPVDSASLYAWHARAGAFERLTPPWQDVRVLKRCGGIEDGGRIDVRVHQGLIGATLKLEHRHHRAGERFEDHLLEGPLPAFRHAHLFEAVSGSRSRLIDDLAFSLPGGRAGEAVAGGWVEQQLRRVFAWRHTLLRHDLEAHRRAGVSPMRVVVSGATGLIGSRLSAMLTTGGHEVVPLTRHGSRSRPVGAEEPVFWSWQHGQVDASGLEGSDAVVHLAAEPILGRWTEEKKRLIRESRVRGTRLISETLAGLARKPRVLVVASAIGFYGHRGDEELDECSESGEGFLAEVAEGWEEATRVAEDAGIRVVHARIGLVMTPKGAALEQMLPAFRWGVGGKIGDGGAWWSWISLDDVVGGLHHCLTRDELSGAVNLVGPEPVTNEVFTRALGKVLGRPTLVPVPRKAVRLAFGSELADEVLLASQRVRADKLVGSGYRFRHPDLSVMLRTHLGLEEAR